MLYFICSLTLIGGQGEIWGTCPAPTWPPGETGAGGRESGPAGDPGQGEEGAGEGKELWGPHPGNGPAVPGRSQGRTNGHHDQPQQVGMLDFNCMSLNHKTVKDDLDTPWASKRHEELRTDEKEDKILGEEEVAEDEENKNSSMDNLSKYLAGLVGNFGNKIITRSGSIDWVLAKK